MPIGNLQKATETGDAGRIVPNNWTPEHGAYALCLGHDEPGQVGRFNDGDYIQVAQTADFGTEDLLRIVGRTRGASSMPAGTAWYAVILVDGTVYAEREVTEGMTRESFDMGVNVAHFAPGNHTLALRLEFRDSTASGDSFESEIPALYLDQITFLEV